MNSDFPNKSRPSSASVKAGSNFLIEESDGSGKRRLSSRPSSAILKKEESIRSRPISSSGHRQTSFRIEEKEDNSDINQCSEILSPGVPAKGKDEITLVIRPVCDDWRMGEDWEVNFPFLKTFVDLKAFIEDNRGISQHRIQIRLKGKLLTPGREKWTLRRMGIYDGYVIQIEPTLAESWWWNPYEYYVENYLRAVEEAIESADGGIFLTTLETKIEKPKPIKSSLKVFLRTYPDRIHIHCNTVLGTYWITKVDRELKMPTFTSLPHDLGRFRYDKIPDFDWDSYKDIDDKYREETVDITKEDYRTDFRSLKKDQWKSSRKSDLEYLLGEKDEVLDDATEEEALSEHDSEDEQQVEIDPLTEKGEEEALEKNENENSNINEVAN